MHKTIIKFIITSLLLLLPFAAFATTHYAIIVDAGSSGSRLHLFQYVDAKPLPVINDIFSENIAPGLSSFASDPNNAGASLKKLFDDATDKLKAQHIDSKDVSVNILATAGMRLVSNEAQQAIYQNINVFLKSNYNFNIQHIETIPGKMEGVYGWLDVNYLANRFDNKSDSTYGIIDMGGASSEIAFATTDTSKSSDEEILNIANNQYIVYSKSYLSSGQDKTREAMNANSDAGTCYPQNYQLNGSITGRFNYSSCSSLYTPVIGNFFHQGDLPITNSQDFIAYSGIYYAFHFFDADQQPTKENITNKVQEVCSKTWEQLRQDPKYANVADKFLSAYCANGVYQTSLLFNSYQIQSSRLHVQDKVDSKSIDWTLGALLYTLL